MDISRFSQPIVSPEVFYSVIGGLFAAWLVRFVIRKAYTSFSTVGSRIVAGGVAVSTGIFSTIKVSPEGVFAEKIETLFQVVPSGYPLVVEAFLTLGTLLLVISALRFLWREDGIFGPITFLCAFICAGYVLYNPEIGPVLAFLGSWLILVNGEINRDRYPTL